MIKQTTPTTVSSYLFGLAKYESKCREVLTAKSYLVICFKTLMCLCICISWSLFSMQIVVAMAVGTWYFTRNKSTIGSCTVRGAICTSLFYHSGTAAFGSLVIATIKTIRAVVAYIQKQAKDSGNKIAQVTLWWYLNSRLPFRNHTPRYTVSVIL